MSENTRENQYRIPQNFIDEGTVLGGMIKTRNLAEALVMAVPVAYLVFKIVHNHLINWAWQILIVATVFLLLLFFGIIGLNGDSVTTFLVYWTRYRKSRRITRYNPHLAKKKSEIASLEPTELPRERLARMFGKNTANKATNATLNVYDLVSRDMVFDDDDINSDVISTGNIFADKFNDIKEHTPQMKPKTAQTVNVSSTPKRQFDSQKQQHKAVATSREFAALDSSPIKVPNITFSNVKPQQKSVSVSIKNNRESPQNTQATIPQFNVGEGKVVIKSVKIPKIDAKE